VETAKQIESKGGSALFVEADVSRSPDVAALVERTLHTYGRLDLAHNNAGVLGERAITAECSEENFDRVLAINLKGSSSRAAAAADGGMGRARSSTRAPGVTPRTRYPPTPRANTAWPG
jgi:NAD(P)-dependent dehydrogenase (short-subunit alcohol dehydrogenase family)